MKIKNLVKTITKPKQEPKVRITDIDHRINHLKHVKLQLRGYQQLHNSKSKFIVLLGCQINSDLCVLWSKNKDYNNRPEISDGYLQEIILNDDPVYDYVFTQSQLDNLYQAIHDRKLRLVAKDATMTLYEFIKRIYLKEKKYHHDHSN